MSFWSKMFGAKKKRESYASKSPYLPEKKDEIEIVFAEKFTQKGGKFIYSENLESTYKFFKLIIEENQWKTEDIISFDPQLCQRFGLGSPPNTFDPHHYKALLMGCEYLIANIGNLLVCRHQIKDFKLEELPDFFIVFSSLDRFVGDVSEGMSELKKKYANPLPTNITTLNVKNVNDENDFLSYGNSAKNLYLILQEN